MQNPSCFPLNRYLTVPQFVAAMAENRLPLFASQQWMTVPYQDKTKSLFDELVDVLFLTQQCLAVAQSFITSKDATRARLRAELTTLVNDTAISLDLWKWKYLATGMVDGIPRRRSTHVSKTRSSPAFTDIPTAALAAFYYASRMISLRLLSVTEISLNTGRLEEQTRRILAAAEFVQSMATRSTGFGPIMTALQVRIASLFGFPSTLRDQACKMLDKGINVRNGAYVDIATNPDGYFQDVARFTRTDNEG